MKNIAVLCFLFVYPAYILSQNILIDGDFSDWQGVVPAHIDNTGDQGTSQIDFEKLWVSNDPDFLFFHFEVGKELNLQDNNDIEIWIDTDNDPASGVAVNGIGADLFYSFGNRMGFVYIAGTQTVYHNDLGLVAAPTVTSNSFELAFRRNISISGQELFSVSDIKFVIKDNFFNGDVTPDAPGGIEYSFQDLPPPSLPTYSIEKTDPTHLRILSYNVLFDGLFEFPRSVSISRLIQAIRPEIISFQEIYDYASIQVRDQVEMILPSSDGEIWYHAKAGPDVHTISRFPILNTFTIDGNGAFLLDLNEKYGTDLLLIGAHLPCCGNNSNRQLEVDAIMAFIRDAKAGTGALQLSENTPIVILGDLNLVGEAQQLHSLLDGNIINEWIYGDDFIPDWDGNAFKDAHPFTTGLPMSFTWFDEGSSFSPGRLDYIIYSGSGMELKNSFALFTRMLPPDSLTAYNLMEEDAIIGSDHLPVVADFQLPAYTAVNEPASEARLDIQVFPNPAAEMVNIHLQLPQANNILLTVCDLHGKTIDILLDEYKSAGLHQLYFDPVDLPHGLYILKLLSGSKVSFKKFIITQ